MRTGTIAVRHKFETAHRLPFLGGKCTNLHGHSWHVAWTFVGKLDANGLLVDFTTVKKFLHGWVDEHLDHGAMLGRADSLLRCLQADGSKVYIFGTDRWVEDLPWPTVEATAALLGELGQVAVAHLPDIYSASVVVTETRDNSAGWGGIR